MKPVFMGGTGRSGTTVTAALIDRHPAYRRIRTEVKFVAVKGGLCDLAEGRTNFEAFVDRLLGEWFQRGPTKGLQAILDRPTVEAALPELRDGLRSDPWSAGRAFTHRLLDPIAEAAGAATWIEMTPANVLAARGLFRMFPDMRLLHSVRDGRDAACSVVPMPWGPDDLDDALDWWGRKLERGFAACDALPADRVLVVQMEDLIIRDRERQYARILDFLGVDDDPAMHAFFDTRMTAAGTHAGRWRTDVPADRLAAFEAHYRRLADRLARQGRPYHPVDDTVTTALPGGSPA
jgi:Sulfotransferase family